MAQYISRKIEATILEAIKYFPVIIVTGPRQAGKSTMIQHLFPSFVQHSLEDYDLRSIAQSDPKRFLQPAEKGLVIDEVQNVPELLSYIQGIVDREPERRYVLSGSANFTLLHAVKQSLAGRAFVVDLLPLSLDEVVGPQAPTSTNQLLFSGLYPSVVTGQRPARFMYPAYVRTYLERDVQELINAKNLMQFSTFLKLCAGRIGQIFNASQVATEVGVSVNTIKQWLSILETSYVIFRLQPYFKNTTKRLVKSPKIYFCDTGLACHLLGIDSADELESHSMRGALFENLIVTEALKHRFNQAKTNNLCFYRDSNHNEIDLLIEEKNGLKGIEVKSSMTYHASFEKALKKMETLVSEPVTGKAVVYDGDFENEAGEIKIVNFRHLPRVL
ncbi:MAG: ATP-binding protein [Bacteroidales bacterium]|nr:ATP-binding protein [Bacteroidales bacterium]